MQDSKNRFLMVALTLTSVVGLVALGILVESKWKILGGKNTTFANYVPGERMTDADRLSPYVRLEVKNTILKRVTELNACYREFLTTGPKVFEGRVKFDWRIDPKGRATSPEVVFSQLNSADLEKCMATKIASWVFPVPPDGETHYVEHSFIFKKEEPKELEKLARK